MYITKRQLWFLLFPVMMIFAGCDSNFIDYPPDDVTGYKPVYMAKAEAENVFATTPQALEQPGKIYIYGGWLFLGETGKGIHIFDNTDPSNPQKKAFVNIPGNHDMAVRAGNLYADNVNDLVVFDISDMQNITFVHRVKGAIPILNQLYPAAASGQYFECVDTTHGVVVDWVLTTLKNPKCYR